MIERHKERRERGEEEKSKRDREERGGHGAGQQRVGQGFVRAFIATWNNIQQGYL